MTDSSSFPSISIIVPVYNTETYLNECLDSLCDQTYSDIEILCIDDGSTDGSTDILEKRAATDSRIRVFRKDNGGVSSARNFALSKASGAYILFVDSDDYIALNTCEKLLKVAHTHDAEIVVFGGETFPPVEWIEHCFSIPNLVRKDSIDALFGVNGSYPLMCNKLYSRNLIERNNMRFNESLKLGEDNAFQFCIFPDAHCVAFCQDVLYFYRCGREGSAIDTLYEDVAKKVGMHFDVVDYVTRVWAEKGYLDKNGQRLLIWMLDFLYEDMKDLSFNDRAIYAGKIKDLADHYKLNRFLDGLDPYWHRHFAFLTTTHTGVPKVTFIAQVKSGHTHLREGFKSLSRQDEVDIEILCINNSDSPALSQRLETCINGDPRARYIGDGEDSLSKAISEASGSYVIICDLNDTYEDETATVILESAKRSDGADIITFRNRFHGLRTQPATRLLRSFETTTAGAQPKKPVQCWFEPSSYDERLFNFSSLSSGNKAFARSFLQKFAVSNAQECSVALALIKAPRIMPIEKFLIEINDFRGIDFDTVRTEAENLLTTFILLKQCLIEEGLFGRLEKTYVNAVLSSFFSYCDLIRSSQAAEAFCPVFAQAANQLIPLDTYGPEWFYEKNDYLQVKELLTMLPADFIMQHNFFRLDNEQDYIRSLEDVSMAQNEHILEFYDSISYRIGRAATALPRKAITTLRKLHR